MNWILSSVLAAVFAALVAVFGKIGVKGIDSTSATTLRAIIMAVFLVAISLVLGKFGGIAKIDRKALVYIILAGVSGALSWLAYFYALQHGPAKGVAALDRTSVALVFVFAVLFLGELFTWKGALGAAMIVGGAVLMIL